MGSKLNGVNYQVVAVETFLSRDGIVGEGGKVESFGGANREDTNKQFQALSKWSRESSRQVPLPCSRLLVALRLGT